MIPISCSSNAYRHVCYGVEANERKGRLEKTEYPCRAVGVPRFIREGSEDELRICFRRRGEDGRCRCNEGSQ